MKAQAMLEAKYTHTFHIIEVTMPLAKTPLWLVRMCELEGEHYLSSAKGRVLTSWHLQTSL